MTPQSVRSHQYDPIKSESNILQQMKCFVWIFWHLLWPKMTQFVSKNVLKNHKSALLLKMKKNANNDMRTISDSKFFFSGVLK